jgi:hypothetical protein
VALYLLAPLPIDVEITDEDPAGVTGRTDAPGKRWVERIDECDRLRRSFQEQQAVGLMTLDELRERLGELEDTRGLALAEMEALAQHERRVQGLERDRGALLESYAEAVPDALDGLESGERNRLYRMLRLEVTPSDGNYVVSGAFCDSGFSP